MTGSKASVVHYNFPNRHLAGKLSAWIGGARGLLPILGSGVVVYGLGFIDHVGKIHL